MTNLLYKSLGHQYNVQILSTTLISKKSDALLRVNNKDWTSVGKEIYNKFFYIKLTSVLAKLIYKHKEPSYFFIKNKFTKSKYDFDLEYKKIIDAYVRDSKLVIYSDEISGKWLNFIIEACEKYDSKLILRVTGKIYQIPKFLIDQNFKFNILVHSKENSNILKQLDQVRLHHIDQTTNKEQQLLNLNLNPSEKLTYGFIGRFSQEKGFMELINLFAKNKKPLVIAGNGPLLDELRHLNTENIQYIGQIKPEEISKFYNLIDVVIIPSLEEGGPIVGVEAMAAGKLIISTKVGAMEDRLMNSLNTFWFSHENKDSLNKAIKSVELLSKDRQVIIREELRTLYLKNNSMDVIKFKYLNLFNSILTDKKI